MEALTPELLRSFERLAIVFGGTLSIILGYQLFKIARLDEESGSGKFKSKLFEFSLAKAGPGTFFAVFGALVFVVSMWTQLESKDEDGAYKKIIGVLPAKTVTAGQVEALKTAMDAIPDAKVKENVIDALEPFGIRLKQR